jgi:hypothetical protein
MGMEVDSYIHFLDYSHAKRFIDSSITAEKWEELREKRTPKEVMIDYMEFAWEKAKNFRGLSAMRTLLHYTAWLWLDGDETLWKTLSEYEFYGKDRLIEICNYLGLDHTEWDDGIRKNSED